MQGSLRKRHELVVPCSIYSYDFLVRLMRLPAAKKATFILTLAFTAQLLRPQHYCSKVHALGLGKPRKRSVRQHLRLESTILATNPDEVILSLGIIIIARKNISTPPMKQMFDRAAVPCTIFIQRHGCSDLFSGNLRAVFGLNTRLRCTSR